MAVEFYIEIFVGVQLAIITLLGTIFCYNRFKEMKGVDLNNLEAMKKLDGELKKMKKRH